MRTTSELLDTAASMTWSKRKTWYKSLHRREQRELQIAAVYASECRTASPMDGLSDGLPSLNFYDNV